MQNLDYTQKQIAKFSGISLATVERSIRNYKLNLPLQEKAGGKHPKGTVDKQLEKKALKLFERRRNDSVRDMARKLGTSTATIQRIKKRNGYQSLIKQNVAKKTPKQFNKGIDRAQNFERFLRGKKNSCMVMDDETYVKLDFAQMPGKQRYLKKRGTTLSESETTFGTEKFPQKRLIWQAICECGLKSSPYVATRTMDTDLYINECLKKRLLPFIAQHNVPCFFWPDLAPMHYSRATLQFCKDNDINIVPTVANPPNVPEDRPIETYWKLIKDELKKEPRAAQDDQDFKYRWKRASSRIAEETIKSMMSTVRQKIKFRSQMERMVEP